MDNGQRDQLCYCEEPDTLLWARWVPPTKHGKARDEFECNFADDCFLNNIWGPVTVQLHPRLNTSIAVVVRIVAQSIALILALILLLLKN